MILLYLGEQNILIKRTTEFLLKLFHKIEMMVKELNVVNFDEMVIPVRFEENGMSYPSYPTQAIAKDNIIIKADNNDNTKNINAIKAITLCPFEVIFDVSNIKSNPLIFKTDTTFEVDSTVYVILIILDNIETITIAIDTNVYINNSILDAFNKDEMSLISFPSLVFTKVSSF